MALCTLCQTIPFDSIPSVFFDGRYWDIADNHNLPLLHLQNERDWDVDVLGFPWHQTLGHLAASAASSACPICGLIQQGVDTWIGHFHKTEQGPKWEELNTGQKSIPEDQQLCLARRPGGSSGFIVFTRHSVSREFAILLSGVSLSVDADSPLADILSLRPMDLDSSSVASQNVAVAWLESCIRTHEHCRHSLGDTPLPSRVLYVGITGTDVIKLIECPVDVRGKYACLSHCWGSTGLIRTTRATYLAHKAGIPMAHLPRSFADAVVLTRRLGLPFLWIDSLCILQDDRDDWAREASRMADVYSQAKVVLAVDRASDSAAGMFHIRKERPTVVVTGLSLPSHDADVVSPSPSPCPVRVQLLHPDEERSWGSRILDAEPLGKRGWTLQERVLGRRVLHFGEHQMYYECCSSGLVGENGCRNVQRDYVLSRLDGDSHGEEGANSLQLFLDAGDHLWYNLVLDYGFRKLTHATDKLPAMSGLARLIAGPERDGRATRQYVAGLWSERLVQGMAWRSSGGHKPATRYIGPSWSWASFDGNAAAEVGATAMGSLGTWHEIAQVIEWHVELDNEANPYGEVKDAWIRLRAPITRLSVSKKGMPDDEPAPFPKVCTEYSQDDDEGELMYPDYEEPWPLEAWRDKEIYALILIERRLSDSGKQHRYLFGIVVMPMGEDKQEPRTMKRVGWMWIWEDCERLLADLGNRTVVTLV